MNLKTCTLCNKSIKRNFKSNRCRFCYETERNKALIAEIGLNFLAAGVFNDEVFKICLSDLEQFKVMRQDVRMATRVASVLSQEEILKPQIWPEAVALSKKLAIRYSSRPQIRCPIMRLSHDLEKNAKDHAPEFRLENNLMAFDSATRHLVRAYFDEVSKAQKSKITIIRMSKCIWRLQRYLNLNGSDLFKPSSTVAQDYFNSLNSESVANTHKILAQLRRFYHWSITHGLSTINPFEGWYPESMNRVCEKCRKSRVFTENNQLFDVCWNNSLYLARLNLLSQTYQAASPYNQHLFDLYIKYLKRSGIRREYVIATESLIKFLEKKPLPAIRSWHSVTALSKELTREQKPPLHIICPFIKIGRMLQELGVLPIRQLDKEVTLETIFSKCPEETSRALRRYSQQLIKMKCAMGGVHTMIYTIAKFQYWLTKYEPALSLFTLSEKTALAYLQALRDRDRSGIQRKAFKRFYRWAMLERLTLMNPFGGIPVPKIARSHCVCGDQQIRKIELYVKNSASDPEYALMLTLVLYWGLTTVELAMSTIEIHDSQIWINLYRRQLRRGRKSRNREQVLKIPLEPSWLSSLQKKYIRLWRERYELTQRNFPNQPLMLRRSSVGRSTRPLTIDTVINYFYKATIAATGQRIPPNVVRRTSGHIHVDHGDASRLTKLGWSQSYCHGFSYLPRTYFTPSKKS